MVRRVLFPCLAVALLAGGIAVAQTGDGRDEESALALAKRQAEEARQRSERLEQAAGKATDEAARTRARASALAARIEESEADITAAETRIHMIEARRAAQRARLAERRRPLAHLTAALQMMARRPPALALVQPGSLRDTVHVRALLASTLPIIRDRTAALRAELAASDELRRQADEARKTLVAGQEELRKRKRQLAKLEERQLRHSRQLANSALTESDKALAFGEDARDLAALMKRRDYQAKLRADLADLPGPMPSPVTKGSAQGSQSRAVYRLPIEGRLVTGMGEISDSGVHARGLTFRVSPDTQAIAPAAGRIAYAGPFRGYGRIVIIAHKGGWTSAITGLSDLVVRPGETVAMGDPIGRTGAREALVSVELRRNGDPVPITPLLPLG